MSGIRDIIDEEGIRAMVNSFVASMDADDKEIAREKAHKITNFIDKFPSDLMLVLYKNAEGKATALLPNKSIVQFHTDKQPETYNLSEILNEAIDGL